MAVLKKKKKEGLFARHSYSSNNKTRLVYLNFLHVRANILVGTCIQLSCSSTCFQLHIPVFSLSLYIYIDLLNSQNTSSMDKTSHTLSSRSQVFAVLPSLRLVRSRSGSSPAAITTPGRTSRRFSQSERFIKGHHSKSTSSRSRTHNGEEENINPPLIMRSILSTPPTISQENNTKSRDDFRKFLKHGFNPDNNAGASKGATSSGVEAPSTWALSTGRPSLGSPLIPMGPELSAKANVGGAS